MSDYNFYANAIESVTSSFNDEVQKVIDKNATIMQNKRLSDIGKREDRAKNLAELENVIKNLSAQVRNAAADFCRDYAVVLPSDDKDHAQDIQNALRVIGMLGEKIDEKNLDNILAPLKSDYKSMKYVLDVIEAKLNSGRPYSIRVFDKVREYYGMTDDYMNYAELYEKVREVATGADCFSCEVTSYGVSEEQAEAARIAGATVSRSFQNVTLRPMTAYAVLSLPDVMRRAGVLFEKVKTA